MPRVVFVGIMILRERSAVAVEIYKHVVECKHPDYSVNINH